MGRLLLPVQAFRLFASPRVDGAAPAGLNDPDCAQRRRRLETGERNVLKRVQSVYYTVKDMDRAVSFYEGVFGLKLKFRDGARWAQFDGGNVSFALSSPEESASLEGGAVAALEVDDLAPYEAKLAESGCTIIQSRDMGSHGRVLAFRDPEGNIIQLFAKAAG
jgi:predicted enzyme related to lactoylglutathione lyase